MFLTDFHVHSTCSFDARNTMKEMQSAARGRGISAMCFTDHCDIFSTETLQIDGVRLPECQAAQLAKARADAPDDFFVGLGLELGAPNHDPELALKIYAMPEYDFILGSLHNLRGREDFYYIKYESEEQCHELYDRYMDELLEIAAIPCFDVMAHIGYCVRYMNMGGLRVALTMDRYGDKIDALLRALIENGRGLEVNCADLVAGGRKGDILFETIPGVPILRRYRELGGEIVTVGSDSHTVRAAGLGVKEGCELLSSLGYRYVTMYKGHRPGFIRI